MFKHFLAIALIASTLVVSSCKKDDVEDLGPFSAKIDGVLYKPTSVTGTLFDLGGGAKTVTISGISGFTTNMQVTLSLDKLNPGTHQITQQSVFAYTENGDINGSSQGGSITVTEHNTTTKVLKGTFQGAMTNNAGVTKQLTEGQFNVTYQ